MPVMTEPRVSRFDLITPAAERQIDRLHPRDRNKVVKTLEHPIRLDRCKRMRKEKNVWRTRVTDSLRITFCRIGNEYCVVHVGTHAESDHFVDHVNSTLGSNPMPLKESLVMRANNVALGAVTQESPNNGAVGESSERWRELMEQGIRGLVDHVMISELEAIRELATDEIKRVGNKLDDQSEVVTKLAERLDDLAGNVEQSKGMHARQADELAGLVVSLRDEVKRHREELARQIANAGQELDRQVAGMTESLTQIAARTEDRLGMLNCAVTSGQQHADRLDVEIARINEQQEHAGAATRNLAEHIEQMQAALIQMRNDVTVLAEQHNVVTSALAELEIRQETLASRSWTAHYKRCVRAICDRFQPCFVACRSFRRRIRGSRYRSEK